VNTIFWRNTVSWFRKAKLQSVKVALDTHLLKVEGNWEADESEQRAAWELYVELVTRVAVQELKPGEGLLREALSSLYAVFAETRRILRQYGPDLAKPKGEGNLSFGQIAVTVLNQVLRPLLAYWHPLLLAYEHTRPPSLSPVDHERAWERDSELREALDEVRTTVRQYSYLLARAAGIEPIRTGPPHSA
jgi:hypothetical protein